MEGPLALVVGILIATGVYLMLARNLLHYLFGLILISNAANLAIFVAGRVTRAAPPLIPQGMEVAPGPIANPLPQALILTAIVIGFGLLAFALALIAQAYKVLGTLDVDTMRIAEPIPPKGEKSP
ncbi:Na+/H+ antiporter subunit C [Microbulbifer sp. THAF38]|uniref:Na+/H+ antiporter subunit C n=1 Tax=unclassified Microbulbifer TaxID=2619833 RepID=UPI00126787DE|nr:Na+/H+ antiporter subunit C [Microbulbifer sp. THAF38]QFT56330.1 Na(+)/H(+) antiporter subunit C [Microbulbifer sp. THAF38]